MTKNLAYYNQEYVFLDQIRISPLDRSYVFGDGVYEVIRVYNKKIFLLTKHLERLQNSLKKIKINFNTNFEQIISKLIQDNNLQEGIIYIQISRGEAKRKHNFKNLNLTPNILIYTQEFLEHPCKNYIKSGISAITTPDLRWHQCDIKSINLLPNILALDLAEQQNSHEAIFVNQNNFITETTAANIFLVLNNKIYTPNLDNILPGITRDFLIAKFMLNNYEILTQELDKNLLFEAQEVFITSTTKEALAITKINNIHISDSMGPICTHARELILEATNN